ncbi:MAG: hypothetical protein M3N32_07755 [Actinomycetota bacterium]|nr:hypothetical protein [Actinomycetota bacterium]
MVRLLQMLVPHTERVVAQVVENVVLGQRAVGKLVRIPVRQDAPTANSETSIAVPRARPLPDVTPVGLLYLRPEPLFIRLQMNRP